MQHEEGKKKNPYEKQFGMENLQLVPNPLACFILKASDPPWDGCFDRQSGREAGCDDG